jgi:hypothetical protein
MGKEISITIKAHNQTKAAIDASIVNVEKLREKVLRTRSAAAGFQDILRGDIASGLTQIGASFMGKFGSLATKLGVIGAAFGAGWGIGKWLRDVTGIGKWLDKLVVQAPIAAKSISDMVRVNVGDLSKSLEATRDRLGEIKKTADQAAAALNAMYRKKSAVAGAEEERQIAALRSAEPEGPVREAKEKAIRATAAEREAIQASEQAAQKLRLEEDARKAITDEIENSRKAIANYSSEIDPALKRAKELLDAEPGSQGFEERVKSLVKARSAITRIEETQKHIDKLTKDQAAQQVEVVKAEAEVERASGEVVKNKQQAAETQQGILDAVKEESDKRLEQERKITDELDKQTELKADIAEKEEELARETRLRTEEEAAASARAKAQEMRDKLEARRALGAAGSKELAEADKKERDRDKRVAKIKQDRAQLGLQMGQFGAADIEEGGKLDEQGIAEQERFLQIMRQLHITNRTGKPIGAKELEEEAKKQGRPLNQKDLELVRRAGMQAQEAELAMLAKNWEGMLKANQDAERELREQNQARNIAESKVRLDQIAEDIKKMGVVV